MLATASISSAQLTITTEGGEAAMGSQLEVDITANMFNELATFQFNVVWDSLVMKFVEVKNVNSDLPSYTENTNFGLPGDGSISDGTVSTSWTNFNGAQSLSDDVVLFTIVLDAVGAECATSSFGFENEEAGDGNFEEVSVTSTGGDILVSGPDCGDGGGGSGGGDDDCVNECEGSTDVILSMPCIISPAGSSICVPITVYNFNDIEAVQTGIVWDPSVMTYTGFQNLGFVPMGGNNPNSGFIFNENNSDEGMVRQFWSDDTGETPQSLPDGSVLYEMCFDLTGDDGDMTTIDFADIGNFGVEIVQLGVGVPFCLDQGKITIGNPPVDPVELIANDVTGNQNGEACVDITVRSFTDVRGYQANLQWDNSILDYNRVQMLNSTLGLTMSNFNFTTGPDNLRFTWDNLNPATLDDDDKLFQVCFDVVGDCAAEETSAVTFESTTSSDIEFSDPNGQALPFTISNGSVTVLPCVEEHSCNPTGITQPACFGDDGSITVDVNADDTCECNWYLNGGSSSIQTTPGNGNCNLTNVGAGSYTFELSDASGTVVCTFVREIVDPTEITTSPSVSNAGCGDTGSITLNAVGGTGNLSYSWTPAVSDSDSATDLPAGDYTIMIFDDNDCSITVMETITSELDPLAFDLASTTVVDPTCNGSSDGSITGAAMGGCPPYTFTYEGGDGTGLGAGDYGITVTDANGSTAEGSATLTDPLEIMLTASIINQTIGMTDGSITITPSNGTEPYSYAWNPDVSNTNEATGLEADFYSVTVTDANGCTASQSNIEVEVTDDGADPELDLVVATDVEGCFGDMNGSIAGTILNGNGALTVALTGASSETITLAGSGSFSFDNLPAGTYTITVTDSAGNSDSESNIVIDQPEDISVTVVTGDDNNNCDGFIDLTVTGGTSPYSFAWVNQDWITEDVSNVCAGSYDLVITDADGCMNMIFDIIVGGGGGDPDTNCWIASKVITPNDDGLNDFFKFTCVNTRPASLEIFDRYGRQVYTSSNYNNEFNGISDSGVVLGEGGYMWVLNIDFGDQGRQIEKGTLTLLRD